MENLKDGLQTYAKIKTIIGLVFFCFIFIILVIFLIKIKTFKVINTQTKTTKYCTDINQTSCSPFNPIIALLIASGIVLIIIIVIIINLYLVSKYKTYGAIEGGISATSDLSKAVFSGFRR